MILSAKVEGGRGREGRQWEKREKRYGFGPCTEHAKKGLGK